MGFVQKRRLAFIAALSLALHVAVLAWLALPARPTLLAIASDLSLMSVELIAPERSRVRPAASHAPARAERRPREAIAREAPVAPAAPAGVATIPALPSAAAPGVPSDALRAALQTSGGGCARALSREERERCEERLGRITASTPTYAAPIDPGKRAYYDAVVAAGPSGRSYGDPVPAAVTPGGAAYARIINCSIKFGVGKKPKDRQGEVRLGRTPCSIPLQGSFFTPEASVPKR